MSEQDQPKPQPNPLAFLRFRGHDERMQGIKDLLSSDTNNETKTRIPNVFAMTYFDSLGAWAAPTSKIRTEFMGKTLFFDKTVEGLAQYFGMRYRINAISKAGLSREEYVSALSSWLAQQQMVMGTAQQMRMEEGVKKVK
ncbi:MAG: hypothetical protein KGH74_03605 [Candidatus Micrarchaeota archaeon]|nr:hypothetical protein [Candidatus Micrarchaeota archaeon]